VQAITFRFSGRASRLRQSRAFPCGRPIGPTIGRKPQSRWLITGPAITLPSSRLQPRTANNTLFGFDRSGSSNSPTRMLFGSRATFPSKLSRETGGSRRGGPPKASLRTGSTTSASYAAASVMHSINGYCLASVAQRGRRHVSSRLGSTVRGTRLCARGQAGRLAWAPSFPMAPDAHCTKFECKRVGCHKRCRERQIVAYSQLDRLFRRDRARQKFPAAGK
jgi:hypothetical protein